MNTVEILKRAKARIDTPEKWIKNQGAKNKDGITIWAWNEDACQWCMLGALWAQTHGHHDEERICVELLMRVTKARESDEERDGYFGAGVANWNDAPERTHADVMAAYDRAIALAERSEAAEGSG